MSQTCSVCGQSGTGRFCAHCGASLEGGPHRCAQCGNEIPEGGRFCNQCGTSAELPRAAADNTTRVEAQPRGGGSPLPWIITGVAVAALIAALALPQLGGDEEPAVAAGPPVTGTTGGAASVDLSSMTPRQAADRLFNRVMQNVSTGDSAQARQFLPMAIAAYQRVPELDADGYYHVAVLQLVGGDPQAARDAAESILSSDPGHLFGLFTAAQAERALGNADASRDLYQRFLDRYDQELQRGLAEYGEHQPVLPTMREEAQRRVE